MKLEFKDVANLSGLGPVFQGLLNLSGLAGSRVDIDMTVPQTVMVSGYHQLTPAWAIVGNIGWQEWSEFGKQEIGLQSSTSRSFTQDLNYNDTWHFALGAQYRFAPEWLWSFGAAYDTSPVDSGQDRTPDLALDRQIRLATGLKYDWNRDVTSGAAYEYIDLGDGSGPDEYLDLIAAAKRAVKIPVIGSLNGVTTGGWIDYARRIEQAGADDLELNIYYVPTDPDLVGLLREKKVEITAKPKEENPWYTTLLVSWLPMLVLIGIWSFFMRQMQAGGGKAMRFGKSRARLMTENAVKITFKEVAGIEEAKEEVAEIIEFLTAQGARSVVMTDGLLGCPHEEGIDYPEGTSCPECPYWA